MTSIKRALVTWTFTIILLWWCLTMITLWTRPSLECSCSCANELQSLKKSELNESGIFGNPQLPMNDFRLLRYIRDEYLKPPEPIPYNLEHPSEDPSAKEGQNRIVLNLLGNKSHGVFLEAGANDGEYLSTTLYLEREWGWTGLLVEPDVTTFAKLELKNRRAWRAGVCLSPSKSPQKIKFLRNTKHSVLSKLAGVGPNTNSWWLKHLSETTVTCFPVYSLLLALNMTNVDYFSLDVEGGELSVLKTIPFDSVNIKVLSVEYNQVKMMHGADAEMKELMKANGYQLVTEVNKGFAQDYIFARTDLLTHK